MFADWIFVKYFAEPIQNLSLVAIVNGALDTKKSFEFTGESEVVGDGDDTVTISVGKTMLNLAKQDVLSLTAGSQRLLDLLEESFENLDEDPFSEKTGLAVLKFLLAILKETPHDLGTVDDSEYQKLRDLHSEQISRMKQRMLDGKFVDDTDVILEYYGRLTNLQEMDSSNSANFADYEGQKIFCRGMTVEQLRIILKINMGVLSIDYIYDKKQGRFFSLREICDKMLANSRGFLDNLLRTSSYVQRYVIYAIKKFVITTKGLYWMLNNKFESVTGSKDMAPALLAAGVALRYANPLSLVLQLVRVSVASAAAAPLVAGLPVLCVGFYLFKFFTAPYDVQVVAGNADNPFYPAPRGSGNLESSNPKGEATKTKQQKSIAVILESFKRFDQRVEDIIDQYAPQPHLWVKELKKMPNDFRQICVSLNRDKSIEGEEFLKRYNHKKKWNSKVKDYLDRNLFMVPQMFFASLKPTLTLDDCIDSNGNVRDSVHICSSVYLRLKTERKPIFTALTSEMEAVEF
jgi:hypothetical protein